MTNELQYKGLAIGLGYIVAGIGYVLAVDVFTYPVSNLLPVMVFTTLFLIDWPIQLILRAFFGMNKAGHIIWPVVTDPPEAITDRYSGVTLWFRYAWYISGRALLWLFAYPIRILGLFILIKYLPRWLVLLIVGGSFYVIYSLTAFLLSII